MHQETQKLNALLNSQKISKADYQLLSTALEKKRLDNKVLSLLINPFQKIAGVQGLILGIVIMLAMSYVGSIAQIYFSDLLGNPIASGATSTRVHPTFYWLLFQNIVNCSVLILMFLLSVKIYKQKGVRLIDVIGTVLMSRYPTFILAVVVAFINYYDPSIFSFTPGKGYNYQPSIINTFVEFAYLSCLVWQIATYFFALKESTGLTENKLWISFMLSVGFGNFIADMIIRSFF